LREAGIAGAQVDIGGQHQLDADGQAVALSGDNHRFADPRTGEHTPRIAAAGGACQPSVNVALALTRSSPAVKVLAMTEHHRHPRFGVGLELAVGQAQFVEQVEVEGVAFGDPIQADHQDMTTLSRLTRLVLADSWCISSGGKGSQTDGLPFKMNRLSVIARRAGPLKNRPRLIIRKARDRTVHRILR
jgi:hypothetical protein